jgi:hypothetical protein
MHHVGRGPWGHKPEGVPKKEADADAGAPVVARVDGKGRWALENKEKKRRRTYLLPIPS